MGLSVQRLPVAPHASNVWLFTRATLPEVAERLTVEMRSGVGRGEQVPVVALPVCIR